MDVSAAASVPKSEIYLADYRPPAFAIDHVQLTFRLFDDFAEVEAVSDVRRQEKGTAPLMLDGGPYMDLVSVAVDGEALTGNAYTLGSDSLTLHDVPDQFSLRIVTRLKPQENTRLEGLYHSGGNFCTQCEAEGFRHITYFVDRPDNLARYSVRIEANKARCPVLLSNGNPGDAGDLNERRHFAEWHDPFPKPSYLFALVAGKLGVLSDSFTTESGRDVALNIYAAPADLDKCGYAMQSLKRSMKWDEEAFGREYDLDVYNIVAVGDFNMGAMENKGLNIFNSKYVLASPDTATDTDFDRIEGIIGHEYFHNWSGNRVTCRDWFQLSLKEGLTVFRDQQFSSDMTSRAVKRLDDVRLLRMLQFPEDAGPLAHPVRPEKYIEINNFYTVTVYNKGAEVIRMMHRLLGADGFRAGTDLYFDRHDGQAVTCEDFVKAMEDANGADLGQFRLWYSQAGTPKLTVERMRDGNQVTLTITQSCPPTPGQAEKLPFHMPFMVGWVGADGAEIRPTIAADGTWHEDGCLLDLRQERQQFVFEGVPEGAVPSLLRDFSCPVLMTSDLTEAEFAFLSGADTDAFARWEATQTLVSNLLVRVVEGDEPLTSLPSHLTDAYGAVLTDENTDPALIAELLMLPSEIDVGQKLKVLEAEKLHKARETVLHLLVKAHGGVMRSRYEALASDGFFQDQDAKAARKLRNVLLGYLALGEDGEALVKTHYDGADNMTDQMAALSLVTDSDFACRKVVLDDFYAQWKDNTLVIDKWFAVQANSKREDTVEVVRALTNHEAFTIKNPNRLRSLVSSFSMLNQVRFHSEDGAGYRFLADMIEAVDAINPQMAAKLVAPLGRWRRLEGRARDMMQESLRKIAGNAATSDDVRELVEKSLT
ncbi:aminopeptidase N [Kordiimonas marina]|uniref:aminopeptidase N n=1 Tax=Kordiimonas marina TaxID=2872312 RepID=UPI001FF1E71E|nr:aminopeptidase N [Kordiimonas marina]MCJ9430357.1 aminopeptidase N [Kordiimonas marina]